MSNFESSSKNNSNSNSKLNQEVSAELSAEMSAGSGVELRPGSQTDLFVFEMLDCYWVARQVLVLIVGHRASLRGSPGALMPQMESAAVSTVANIAEGSGRSTPADKRARWTVARGEANEVAALVEIAVVLGAIPTGLHKELRGLLLRLTRMLRNMTR